MGTQKFIVAEESAFEDRKEDNEFKIISKAETLLSKSSSINQRQLLYAEKKITELEAQIYQLYPSLFGNRCEKIYVHIDLDAFYASVEILYNEKLKYMPVGIGSNLMLATANYEARKYGIRAGMPGYQGKILCPQLKIIKCDMKKYQMHSNEIMELLYKFDNELEIYGIDEAYLYFDNHKFIKAKNRLKEFDCYDENLEFGFDGINSLMVKIRQVICNVTKLTASAGISVCRGLAKLCTSINKPNGQFLLDTGFSDFLKDKPIDKLNGIGPKTKQMLSRSFQIKTVGDLKNNLTILYLILPYKSFLSYFRMSFGLSSFDFTNRINQEIKSVGATHSFPPTSDYRDLLTELFFLSKNVSERMENFKGFVIVLSVKHADFTKFSKQKKLDYPIKTYDTIFNEAHNLFKECFPEFKEPHFDVSFRFLGVKVTGLEKENSNSLVRYFNRKVNLDQERSCIICNKTFIYEKLSDYESHVNYCINEQERKRKEENKKKSNTLLKFFTKKFK